jgi:hypothetical protein
MTILDRFRKEIYVQALPEMVRCHCMFWHEYLHEWVRDWERRRLLVLVFPGYRIQRRLMHGS